MSTRQSTSPWFRRGAWKWGGLKYPKGWKLGLYLPRWGIRSRLFVPSPKDRMALGPDRYPYWYVLDYTGANAPIARDSGDDRLLPDRDFTALALLGNSDQAAPTFTTGFFQVIGEGGFRFQRVAVDSRSMLGTARFPLLLKHPFHHPNGEPLLNRVINLTTLTNSVQVVVYGVKQ